jgi:hypothetical protein
VLDVRRVDRLLGAGGHEDLDGVVTVTNGALVERALDAGRNLGKLLVRVSDPST